MYIVVACRYCKHCMSFVSFIYEVGQNKVSFLLIAAINHSRQLSCMKIVGSLFRSHLAVSVRASLYLTRMAESELM